MDERREREAPREGVRERGAPGSERERAGGRSWRAQVQELEARVSELEAQLQETQDKYLRALAEMDNFRKRAEREQAEMARAAGERLISNLLEVLDALDQAVGVDPSTESAEGVVEGLSLLRERFREILEREGLSEIGSVGEPFDPNVHEAVMQVESEDHPTDTVVMELRKGYRLHERLLRPARVAVAK